MPEYSSTTITPADSVKTPAMNGSTSGNYELSALKAYILASKGLANGLASLDANGKLPTSQLPDLADDVLVYGSYALLPSPGTAGKLYITADDNKMYRWDDALAIPAYVELSVDLSDYATKAEVAEAVEDLEAADTDLKNALTAVDHRVQNLEQAKGDYVPVDSDKGVISVPSGKGKWAVVEKLRGVSRAWNQLVNSLYTRPEIYGLTREATADGGIRIYGTCTSSTSFTVATMPSVTSGHSYLTSLGATLPAGCRISTSSDDKASSAVSTLSTATFGIDVTSGLTIDITLYPMCRDLTLYFGSSVPTLAEIQTYYPWLLSPSDYGTSLVDSVYEGVGSNWFDGQTELGYYRGSDGAKYPSTTQLRTTNKIVVEGGISYTVEGDNQCSLRWYDSSNNYISGNDYTSVAVSPTNARYLAINFSDNYGTVYKHNIWVYPTNATHTLSLPSPITLRSAGSVADEYDLESGVVTHPTRLVNLGTLTWIYETWNGLPNFYTRNLQNIIKGVTPTTLPNLTSDMFPIVVFNDNQAGTNLGLSVSGSGNLDCRITNGYTDVTSFKNWVNNHYIVIELATADPSTLLDPIQNPTILTESGGTISAQTEEPIDGNFSVGFITL